MNASAPAGWHTDLSDSLINSVTSMDAKVATLEASSAALDSSVT
eukprot:CAMPEP_0116907200 /NCGR_PEP_ID=MMETSP0467-20121206/12967_1 /TAXON_ID=283647 /ORGANISM="Mesodinium pulex, Strain SPMC105" /LENGTH=43 /DNA_ID= /DNA_START= /DNA_END= /DNA_ORIENTATION=